MYLFYKSENKQQQGSVFGISGECMCGCMCVCVWTQNTKEKAVARCSPVVRGDQRERESGGGDLLLSTPGPGADHLLI